MNEDQDLLEKGLSQEAISAQAWAEQQDELARRTVDFAATHTSEVAQRLATAGLRPEEITGVASLQRIPVLSKDSLPDLQAENPPFGGMLAVPVAELRRIYMSPGPIFDPEGGRADAWRFAAAFRAAGFRPGDVVLNSFSYHLTPAGMMMDEALRAVGCTVIPGGVGNSDQQVEVMARTGVRGYTGTPDFLRALVELAASKGLPIQLERAFVSGGPLPESLRRSLEKDHGLRIFQGYGTADAGALGYECDRRDGWHVAPGAVIEIVDPASGRALAPGETGEVVATVANDVYPLVRFGTGDLSALDIEPCPCGRVSPRLQGWQGRVGDGVKVRGMFVHARQLAPVCESSPGVKRYQAVVRHDADKKDQLLVRVEGDKSAIDPEKLAEALRGALKLRAEVEVLKEGTVAEDSPVIVDERSWD